MTLFNALDVFLKVISGKPPLKQPRKPVKSRLTNIYVLCKIRFYISCPDDHPCQDRIIKYLCLKPDPSVTDRTSLSPVNWSGWYFCGTIGRLREMYQLRYSRVTGQNKVVNHIMNLRQNYRFYFVPVNKVFCKYIHNHRLQVVTSHILKLGFYGNHCLCPELLKYEIHPPHVTKISIQLYILHCSTKSAPCF